MCIIKKALLFAKIAHGKQVRKYTGEPYWYHPYYVMRILCDVTDDKNILAAACLHDVVEDTFIDIWMIYEKFGKHIAELVLDITDQSKVGLGNRAHRKEVDRFWLSRASDDAKTIKLADLMHNTYSICAEDKNFAKVYMKEIKLLLPYLKEGDKNLYKACELQISEYYKNILNKNTLTVK